MKHIILTFGKYKETIGGYTVAIKHITAEYYFATIETYQGVIDHQVITDLDHAADFFNQYVDRELFFHNKLTIK